MLSRVRRRRRTDRRQPTIAERILLISTQPAAAAETFVCVRLDRVLRLVNVISYHIQLLVSPTELLPIWLLSEFIFIFLFLVSLARSIMRQIFRRWPVCRWRTQTKTIVCEQICKIRFRFPKRRSRAPKWPPPTGSSSATVPGTCRSTCPIYR